MKAKVYFIEAQKSDGVDTLQKKLLRLYDAIGFDGCIDTHDIVGIKLHFGEKNNDGYVPPEQIKPIVERIHKRGAKALLTDTSTLYHGQRSNAIDYLMLCHEHGFTMENVGAPVVISDGLTGRNEIEVTINKKHFNKVALSAEVISMSALFIVTHFTGHMGMGVGGALKNLGMGFASRRGKLRQHSDTKPWIDENKCTGCEECMEWCPVDAISISNSKAHIDHEKCIGCAECLTVCRFRAVRHDWRASSQILQEKCAEHALGAVLGKQEKLVCLTSLLHITQDCDCLGKPQKPLVDDVGFIASRDPVAIDQAAVDIVASKTGVNVPEQYWSSMDYTFQIKHAKTIGLGTDEYEIIEL